VDSAEKVFVMNHSDTCLDIMRLFIQHGWKIIVTIRTAFKNGFVSAVSCTQDYQEYELGRISADELSHLASVCGVALPTDTKLRDLLRNLFYLKLYVSSALEDSSPGDTIERFIARIWDEKVRNVASKRNNLDNRRETAICTIVLSNANEGVPYYVPHQDDDHEAISALEQSGIVAEDRTMGGYYVTHDVYEELVLKHIMQKAFNRRQSCKDFFSQIGNSLVVRKAFRLWLHDVLEAQLDEISGFIVEVLNSPLVESMWKDDVLIALMNESDERILYILSGPLGLDNYALFFRAVFLLNTGCKVVNREFLEQVYTPQELESYNVYRYTKPEGKGWDFMFRYANDHKANIDWNPTSIGLVTEALYSWATNYHEGTTTKTAGQVALYLYDLVETDDHLRYGLNDAKRKKIISAVLNSAQEILPELTAIIENIVSEEQVDHRARYHDLCRQLLDNLGDSCSMCKAAPDLVVSLAKHFWLQQNRTRDPMDRDLGVSTDFGLNHHMDHEYYPSSAFQTPTFSLLQQSPKKALDFIVDLFDTTTEHYAASSLNTHYHECSQMTIHLLDGTTVQQIASSRLWQMYRGTSVAPELLQSVLMALERWLYAQVEIASEEVSVSVCLRLLQSHSVAVTAVVVSIVTAYPDKLFKVACILLHSKEIISFDLSRFLSEMGANFGRGLNFGHQQLDRERISSNALPFRKTRFEDIIVEYQMHQGSLTDEQFKGRMDTLYNDLDSSYADLDSLAPEFRFAYYRMDLRKSTVSVESPTEHNGDTRILLAPSLPEDLMRIQKDTEETINKTQKLEPLLLWCRARYERRRPDYEKFARYENDPQTALKESLEVYAEDPAQILFMQRAIPVYVAVVLLRDFSTSIDTEEVQACTAILTRHLYLVVQQDSGNQMLDGTDAAIALLPKLISGCRNTDAFSFENPAILMLALLLSRGSSRELAVESFREGVLGPIPDVSSGIIGAFVTLKPDYDKEVSHHNGISPVVFLQKNRDRIDAALARRTGYEDLPYKDLDYGASQTLSMLVRPGDDSSMNAVVIGSGSSIWPKMFSDEMHGDQRNEFRDYEQEQRYISWLAEYLLRSRPETQHAVVQGLVPFLGDSRNTESLFRDIIVCEERLQDNESFWLLWDDELFSTVERLCALQRASLGENEYKGEYHGGTLWEIVTTFSLAFPWWTENIRSWHTLKTENWPFFAKLAARLGYHPCVLYSIVRVLNTIGFEFLDQGIDLLSTIVENNPHLAQMPLQQNTEYYLEEYMQRFVRAHRNDMKRNAEMRRRVISILSFLVDRGSTCGFMLREDI
jgi:hypothetical protein